MNKLENFDIFPGTNNGFSLSFGNDFTIFKDFVYFPASEGFNDEELWRIGLNPGDEPGLFQEIESLLSSFPSNLTVVDNNLFFTANNGGGAKVYVTDGITKNNDPLFSISSPNNLIAVGSDLFFFGIDGTSNLYKIDTTQIDITEKELKPAPAIKDIDVNLNTVDNEIAFNGTLYFTPLLSLSEISY